LGFPSLLLLFCDLPTCRFLATTLFILPLRSRTLFLIGDSHPFFDTTFRNALGVEPPLAHGFQSLAIEIGIAARFS
jgi:hypothetical protein